MDLITHTKAVLHAPPEPLHLLCNFCYSPSDPYTVRMILILEVVFPSGMVAHDATPWDFSRELLDSAFSRPGERVGDGDVKITFLDEPCGGPDCECPPLQLQIDLTADHDGQEYPLYVDATPLTGFMAESLRMVPAGAEAVDVDGELAELLGEA